MATKDVGDLKKNQKKSYKNVKVNRIYLIHPFDIRQFDFIGNQR